MNKVQAYSNDFIRQIIDEDLANNRCAVIHTRFPPEPNGYLHIGHAKSICLNFGIAQDYHGHCNLRFDDTNPIKADIKYIESIKHDLQWLGFKWSGRICYSSDYFDLLYEYAFELIKKGLAYVDQLNSEQIREYRGTLISPGKNSPFRDRSIKENITLFKKMQAGDLTEGSACLRAKIDMASPFMVMRDPVLYRIKFIEHHQTGNKWCIYPMYDFAHCISDALEGITHSLCTLEFQDNRRLYDWILDNINIKCRPRQYEFSRLNLTFTIMSKRKLNMLITQNIVKGWDDPRMPTISGLRRRGYTAASIREFCRRIGMTKQNNNIEMVTLESCIRDELNKNAPRTMAVLDPIKIIIKNRASKIEYLTMPNHPNNPQMGNRQVPFDNIIYIDRADFREEAKKHYKRLVLGKEVRLRHAYVIKAEYIEKDQKGNIIIVYCSYDAQTLNKDPLDGRKVKGVIHWVAADYALPADIHLYDHLFNVANPNLVDNFITTINPKSLIIRHGFVEPNLANAIPEQTYQFEREGYFCIDSQYLLAGKYVFNRTVSLRNTWQIKDKH
ncbi:glutamine--tRNA ligase [Candidatus Fukatsuia anoeciicola]|uniref:glutamine--tRNA ligase n=1 Tax=Candidatus Fukatsuia anoeciicola TaxID=2994492 RepID=UPI003463925C